MNADKTKIHKKRVNFGAKDEEDFVDHLNQRKKHQFMRKIRNYHDPFQSNFWRVKLMNTKPTMKESWMDLCDQFEVL